MAFKVIAFDCFGTVFDMSQVNREEISAYVKASRNKAGNDWNPLSLPEHWKTIPAHADSVEGIKLLRKDRICVALTNGPVHLITEMSRNAGIDWDLIVPIELWQVYKPQPRAYEMLLSLYPQYKPQDFCMVTANATFGDIEAATQLGMQSWLIRDEAGFTKDIIDLAHQINAHPH